MTLYKFALIPKTCDVCDRMFIFERYFTFQKSMGIEQRSVKFVECKLCHKEEQDKKDTKEQSLSYSNLAIEFRNTCWKCGKPLDDTNRSPLVYCSDPPKYACTDCDKSFITPEPCVNNAVLNVVKTVQAKPTEDTIVVNHTGEDIVIKHGKLTPLQKLASI